MKKNRRFFSEVLVLALIFGLALTACNNDGGASFISGDIAGTYTGTFDGYTGTLQISGTSTSGTWIMQETGSYSSYETGTYTMSGNTATLYSSSSLVPIGTAGLISSTTLMVTLNAYSGSPGTYTATRPDPGFSGGGGGDITGSWTGYMSGSPVTLTFSSGYWSATGSSGPSESGYYTMSGNTATLYNTNLGVGYIGTATLTGANTMQLTLTGGYYPGTYPFTRSGSSGGSSADITGTWEGYIGGYSTSITFTTTINQWLASSSGGAIYGFSGGGTHTMSGSTATLRNLGSVTIGTATLTSANTMQIILNVQSGFQGTYTFTRSGSSSGSSTDITGSWTGYMSGSPVTLTFISGYWSATGSSGPSESGYYTMSGNTATLYNTNLGAGNIGTATLTGANTMLLTLTGGFYPGTYTFTRSGGT